MHFGFNPAQPPGIVRIEQLQGLLPYLDHLGNLDFSYLWDTCNDRGWFELRRKHFDARVDARHQMYIDRTGAIAELDRLVARNETYWGTRFADKLIESGTTVDEIMALLRDWLAIQTSIVALQIAADIVVHIGRRSDIAVLTVNEIAKREPGLLVEKNAAFGVKRRSLR